MTNSKSRSSPSKIISRNGRHKFEICRGSVAFLVRPFTQFLRFESNVIRTIHRSFSVCPRKRSTESRTQFYFDVVVYVLLSSTLIALAFSKHVCCHLETPFSLRVDKKKIFEFYSTTLFAILISGHVLSVGGIA